MAAVTQQTEEAALQIMTKLQGVAQRQDRLTIAGDPPDVEAPTLSREVGQIVMSLQFQDITRQKLEHVEHALMRVRDHLQNLADGKPDHEVQDSLSLLKDLEHSYTMDSERRIHGCAPAAPRPSIPASTRPATDDDSVTLF
ncbi:hypothetical protein W02_19010 [Nitrospira sp. KM1]|nr:hypothetical protein W02_19010 [Nitrospira sp. KM1]